MRVELIILIICGFLLLGVGCTARAIAKHEPGDSLMSPYINRAMWLDDKAALEISWCLDKGVYERTDS